MTKFRVKNYVVYRMLSLQAKEIFNGLGICDMCLANEFYGYYIPILNSFYCGECFESWKKRCKYYEEDKWFEENNVLIFENRCNELNICIEDLENA